MAGGSFLNGINLEQFNLSQTPEQVTLASGCFYQYENGILSSILQEIVPVIVVDTNYTFGFATQTPVMPEGETETHLGNYTVGTEAAKITFGFSANPLPEILSDSGFTIEEEMNVISNKGGAIHTQNSGAAYESSYQVIYSRIDYRDVASLFSGIPAFLFLL